MKKYGKVRKEAVSNNHTYAQYVSFDLIIFHLKTKISHFSLLEFNFYRFMSDLNLTHRKRFIFQLDKVCALKLVKNDYMFLY